MKRFAMAIAATLVASPAQAHHPIFSWAVIGDHALEWDHLLFFVALLAVGTLVYRRRDRILARVAARRERRHDPR